MKFIYCYDLQTLSTKLIELYADIQGHMNLFYFFFACLYVKKRLCRRKGNTENITKLSRKQNACNSLQNSATKTYLKVVYKECSKIIYSGLIEMHV